MTCSEGYHPEIPYRECCAVCQPDIPDECATVSYPMNVLHTKESID